MTYISFEYGIMLAGLTAVYYLMPLSARWLVLLAGSVLFYLSLHVETAALATFAGTILCSYLWGLALEKACDGSRRKRRVMLGAAIVTSALPLLLYKVGSLAANSLLHVDAVHWIVPAGLAFYSMQMIAYLADVAAGKCEPVRNPAKYALFISFFPQIIQGPISRRSQLASQLFEGHRFQPENILHGFHLILWGFFLKWMIADKAAIFVNAVFADHWKYTGAYLWAAAILYSIQLYADFLSCVSLSRGAARLFGIQLVKNFNQPYFAVSIRDFWRRWHISLGTWLRDYVYIPLGGSRCGRLRKSMNLVITFLVSGLWHGGSIQFLFWGLLHAGYQIAGEITRKPRAWLYARLGFEENSAAQKAVKRLGTFLLVAVGWVIFRATSLGQGVSILRSMLTADNWWVLCSGSLFTLGLNAKELIVLGLSIAALYVVSRREETGSVSEQILRQPLIIRYVIYIAVIAVIWIFGTYGIGFDAQDFIYGGF